MCIKSSNCMCSKFRLVYFDWKRWDTGTGVIQLKKMSRWEDDNGSVLKFVLKLVSFKANVFAGWLLDYHPCSFFLYDFYLNSTCKQNNRTTLYKRVSPLIKVKAVFIDECEKELTSLKSESTLTYLHIISLTEWPRKRQRSKDVHHEMRIESRVCIFAIGESASDGERDFFVFIFTVGDILVSVWLIQVTLRGIYWLKIKRKLR